MSKTIFTSIIFSMMLYSCNQKTSQSTNLSLLPILEITKIIKAKDGYTEISLSDSKSGKYIVNIQNKMISKLDLKVNDRVKVVGDYAESFPVQILNSAKVIKVKK